MQKLMPISFGEQINRLIDTRDREWVDLAGESYDGELTEDSPLSAFLKIGDTYVSQLLETIFESEEKSLTSDQSPAVEESYYRDLTDGLIKLMQAEYRSIRDRAFIRFEMMSKDGRAALGRDIDELISQKREFIRDRVRALKEKLSLRSPEPSPAAPPVPRPVPMEPEALYVSVQAKIRKSMGSEDRKFLETLDRILDAIYSSPIDKKSKVFRLQNVDFLVDQYNAPTEQKNPGVINAALYYLASAANGEAIWLQFGPVVVAYFNKFM